jgi:hypothetical protein
MGVRKIRRPIAQLASLALMAFAATMATPAKANLIIDLDTVFTGAMPTSTPPWLVADFQDQGTNQVLLTLTSHLEVSTEFIDEVAFNVNPAFTPSALSITRQSGPAPTAILHTTDNAQDLTGGGGKGTGFDIALQWTTASGAGRFDDGDVATFLISASGLTAADFDFPSSQGLLIAAHIRGIPGGASGAVTAVPVPEPTSIVLMSLGAIGILAAHRGRRNTA